jgi:hypothetical protein
MAGLAKKLGIPQSTLTNILSARRSASPELIEKIERLAPNIEGGSILAAEALPRGADINVEASHSIGERLNEAYRERLQELQSFEEKTSRNVGEVAKHFESMGSDDVFIFVSATESPFEMNPEERILRPAIANAIRRGACFIYLRPTREYCKGLGYFVDIESQFESFKVALFSALSKEESNAYAGHLVLVQSHVPLFVLPDFKWDIFYSDSIDTPHNALAGVLVTAGTDPNSSGAHVRIPLSVESTKWVFFEAVKAIWQVNSSRRGRGKIPSKVIARLVESAQEEAKQKIRGGP